MSVNVSFATEMVTLTPTLLVPDELGIRVEVNGQVLSRSGNAAADRAQDTTPQLAGANRCARRSGGRLRRWLLAAGCWPEPWCVSLPGLGRVVAGTAQWAR